jgi:hypothetical protein
MPSLSEDDVLDAVRHKMRSDPKFRQDLAGAVEAKNNSWIARLIRMAVGVVVEIGRAVLATVVGWFLGG